MCARLERRAASNPNTPRAHSGPVRISVAYGNIPAPGLGRWGTKDKVPGIVLGGFAERASRSKKNRISMGIFPKI